MLQVGKLDGRKGDKKKFAWTTEAEEGVAKLKHRLLGQLGFLLVDPDKEICASHRRRGLCLGGSPRASLVQWNRCLVGLLESSRSGRRTSDADREREGDLCHCVRAP